MFDFDDDYEDENCMRCDGDGTLNVCPDGMCQGSGECFHGDGEAMCPVCKGSGIRSVLAEDAA